MNKVKILFVNPRIEIRKIVFDNPGFCMTGMLYAASYTKQLGHETFILDSFTSEEPSKSLRFKDEYVIIGENPKTLHKKINVLQPELIFINYSDFHREITLIPESLKFLIKKIKNNNNKIILANFHLSECMKYFNFDEKQIKDMLPEIDYILNGFFEDNSYILNLIEKKQEHNVKYGLLDQNITDIKKYQKIFEILVSHGLIKEHERREKIFPLFTSRGCNYKCFFCSEKKGLWKSYNINNTINNIKFLASEGIQKIFFLDLIANFNKDRFNTILDSIINESIKCHFTNGIRIDLIDDNTVSKLAKCTDILSISIESGNQKVINEIIKKKLNLNMVRKNIELIKKYDIKCYAHYMINSPGETEEEIKNTKEIAKYFHNKYGIIPRIQKYVPANHKNGFDQKGINIVSKQFKMND